MRVFLCAFNGFTGAIPMDSVSSISLYSKKIHANNEQNNKCFSLFRLLNVKKEEIHHCVFIKNNSNQKNIVLFSAKITCETDINEENIYPVPVIFNNSLFFEFIKGIKFTDDTGTEPVLLFNIEKITKYIRNLNEEITK